MFRLLPALVLPLGAVLLAWGALAADVRTPGSAAGLGVSIIVLYRIYFSASHLAPFEQARYFTLLVPLVLLAAAVGWRFIEDVTRGGRRAGLVRASVLALLVLVSVRAPLPANPGLLLSASDRARALPDEAAVPLTRDQQREVRFMLRAMSEAPNCLFVARATKQLHDEPPRDWEFVVFGAGFGVQSIDEVPPVSGADALLSALSVLPSVPRCVRFYAGLDCNIEGGDRCRDAVRGLELIEEETLSGREYNHRTEYGPHLETVRFALYRIRG